MTAKPPKKFFIFCILLTVLLYAMAHYISVAHPLTDITAAAINEWRYWSRITDGLQITSLVFLLISSLWIVIAYIKGEVIKK